MEPLYNIYYAGEVLAGFDQAQVRKSLGALFKAGDATLDKLFSGNAQLLKRECDKATALKYKQAMEKVGAKPVIKSLQSAQAEPAPPEKAPQTAAERIAALAAAPDMGGYQEAPAATASAPSTASAADDSDLGLEPAGTDVLKPEERSEPIVADIDTSAIDLDEHAERLSAEPPAPPPAPDTTHLSMGEVGEDIPTLAAGEAPVAPNTDNLDLSPAGTDFSDCAQPEAAPPELDLSSLELAPAGSDVLNEDERNRPASPPPPTDHISLQD